MKKIKIYLYIGIMSFCTSCSDFLDKVPDERTQIDSPDKVSALLVNAYPKVSYAAIVNTRCDYIIRLRKCLLWCATRSIIQLYG